MSDVKEFNPLAVNILRLQNYNPDYFDLCEIVLFEWLMVKASSFKNQYEFYYSVRRIAEETKIKKAQLATIIKRFEDLGIITVEKKGMPKCSYFHVNKETVIALIPEIYQFSENGKLFTEISKLLSYFGKLLPEFSKHKGTYKEPIKEPIRNLRTEEKGEETPSFSNIFDDDVLKKNSETDREKKAREAAERKAQKEKEHRAAEKLSEIDRLKGLLKRTYESRVNKYNREVEKGGFVRSSTKLVFSRTDGEALYELRQQPDIEDRDITGSFAAFVDVFLTGTTEIKKPVPYFLARKPETGEFDTFLTYHAEHLLYGHEKQ